MRIASRVVGEPSLTARTAFLPTEDEALPRGDTSGSGPEVLQLLLATPEHGPSEDGPSVVAWDESVRRLWRFNSGVLAEDADNSSSVPEYFEASERFGDLRLASVRSALLDCAARGEIAAAELRMLGRPTSP